MKTFSGLVLIGLTLVPTMPAQTETFDISTFGRPAGWSRSESNGVLILQDRKSVAGRVQFCQIYLFPNVPSSQTPTANFQQEWEAKVVGSLGISVQPSAQTETTPDGWTAVTGVADAMEQGLPVRTVLVTATGFGKFVSVLVTVSPNAYVSQIEQFFKDLKFKSNGGPPPGPQSTDRTAEGPGPKADPAPAGSPNSYIFTAPANWIREQARDRIVLTSPMYNNGERCQLSLLPLRSSSAQALGDDAIGTFRQIFQTDPLTSYPSPPPRLATGLSPQGWEYFSIRKLVGGQEGEARTVGVTLLLVKLDSQVATIVGTSKDFLWSQCFGEMAGDAWPRFFASLQFKTPFSAKQAQAAIQNRLAGTWIMATGSVGLRYRFLANGRYEGAGATQHTTRTSDTEGLQSTQAYFGDGAYSFEGNTIVLTGDDHRRSAKFFRLEQVSKDSGRTWSDELCLLDPGATGEVCYSRQ